MAFSLILTMLFRAVGFHGRGQRELVPAPGLPPRPTAPTLQPDSRGVVSAENMRSVMGSADGLWLTVTLALHTHPSSHRPQAPSVLLGVHVQSGLGVKGARRSVKASSVLVCRYHQKPPIFMSVSMELSVVLGRAPGCFCPRSVSRSEVLGCSAPPSSPQFALLKPEF